MHVLIKGYADRYKIIFFHAFRVGAEKGGRGCRALLALLLYSGKTAWCHVPRHRACHRVAFSHRFSPVRAKARLQSPPPCAGTCLRILFFTVIYSSNPLIVQWITRRIGSARHRVPSPAHLICMALARRTLYRRRTWRTFPLAWLIAYRLARSSLGD